MRPEERPDFGPSGYLPERASKRARKIILRAPLGMQWVVGAVVAGVVLLVAGAVFLQRSGQPPAAPWTPVGAVESFAASDVVTVPSSDVEVLVVTAGGRVRAFADATGVAYCAASNRLEAADGSSWNLTGRGLQGTPSLAEHPTLVVDGDLYVDPSRVVPGPEPSPEPASSACA